MFRNCKRGAGIAVVVAASLVGCARQEPGASSATPAAAILPGLDQSPLLDVNDRRFELWDETDAKATVVVFTRTDCPVSNRYAPEVARLYHEFQAQGVRFFLVYVDPKETSDTVRKHLEEYDYPCPGLRDPGHRLVRETGAKVTPEAVVFDAQQKITYRGRIDNLYADFGKARDEATTHDLADALTATLAGKPVAEPETQAVGCYISDLD
jgi:peroxiredoxin